MAWPTNATIPKTATQGASWQPGDMDNAQYQFCRSTGILSSDLDPTTVADKLGLNYGSTIHRGHNSSSVLEGSAAIVTTSQNPSTATTDGTWYRLGSGSIVSNIVLPTDGLMLLNYSATIQRPAYGDTSAGTPIKVLACPFLNGVAVKRPKINGGTEYNYTMATDLGAGRLENIVYGIGVNSSYVNFGFFSVVGVFPEMPTTGSIFNAQGSSSSIQGGGMPIFAAAGTYTVEMKYYVYTAGEDDKIVALFEKDSKMWVEAIGF